MATVVKATCFSGVPLDIGDGSGGRHVLHGAGHRAQPTPRVLRSGVPAADDVRVGRGVTAAELLQRGPRYRSSDGET